MAIRLSRARGNMADDSPPMGTAGTIFLHAIAAAPTGARFAPLDAQLEAALDGSITLLHASAARLWHPVALELPLYARHLGVCAAASPEAGAADVVLARLHASDLYLACAAGRGLAGASQLFVRHFLEPIAAAVQTIDASAAFVEEVRQALHERLLVATDGPPRILQYGGRASLSSWVGVAAQRLALGLMRTEKARQRVVDRAADEPPPLELDPELQYLKSRYSAAFKEALSVAISRLPQRQRTVLRLYTVGGLTLQRIGNLLNVDESTVSRWVQRARESILDQTQRELGERLGIKVVEIPSIARLVTSQLDVSVVRLLSEGEPADHAVKDSG
jgi:RNA polymerase sigma-70 factor (ECF subfamily)